MQAPLVPLNWTAVPWPAGKSAVTVLWQVMHSMVACLPVSGNSAREWSNETCLKLAAATEWHEPHCAPSWPRWASRWQVAHSMDSPR